MDISKWNYEAVPDDSTVLPLNAISRMSGVSKQVLFDWVKRGRLPVVPPPPFMNGKLWVVGSEARAAIRRAIEFRGPVGGKV